MTADPFFAVPRATRVTSQGPVELPILYHDATNVVALFAVDAARARQLLDGTGLAPLPLARGRALAAVSFYEYRDTTVGAYNEVGVALFVLPDGEPASPWRWTDLLRAPSSRRLGAWVVDLPVTTAVADAAGRELWGYPKFVTRIPFEHAGRTIDGRVLDPSGSTICTLAGRAGLGVPAPPLSLMTYTRLDGRLLRTHIDVRGRVTLHRSGTVRFTVGESHHPMAERLRRLGLGAARPLVLWTTSRFQSKLHAGTAAEPQRPAT
jgi:hypothetical protein